MNKVLKIMICLSLCVLINTRVYADETDKLKVDITSKSGESVLIKSGNWFYTALPVLFTLPEKNGWKQLNRDNRWIKKALRF